MPKIPSQISELTSEAVFPIFGSMRIREYVTTQIGTLLRGLDRFSWPSYYWTWDGKGMLVEGSPDEIETEDTLERFFDIGMSPLCFAGRRFRDISGLWIAATPFEDEITGAVHRGQILPPPDGKERDNVTAFVRWVFDEALHGKGMRQIISQMNQAMIQYGRTVQTIEWTRQDSPFGEKVFPVNILDMNPAFFLKDPEGYPPGTYLMGSQMLTTDIRRLPEHLTLWGTAHMYFENPYGISEMRILNLVEKYWRKNLLFWARGNERNGSGAYVGRYGNKLFGKGRESERQTFLQELQKLKSDTITITHVDNMIETLQASIESDSLQGFHEACGQIISLVLTGSVTALQEGRVGGYSKEEATTTRRKSELERYDASLIDEIFNYQLIPPLVDYNFPGVTSYPRMQIIDPDLIFPTTPKDQKPAQEREESTVSPETAKESAPIEHENEHDISDMASFAATFEPPDVLKDSQEELQQVITDMPAYLPQDFDDLPPDDKPNSFTITAMRNTPESLERIRRLKDLLVDTVAIWNENDAWEQYFRQAKTLLRRDEINAVKGDLFVSFRYARQTAYNAVLQNIIDTQGDSLYAIQLLTQDDARVRPQHARWNGVTRPVNDEIWQAVRLPWDHGCRCFKIPIMQADYEAEPNRYRMTPRADIPPIPEGF